MRIILLTSLIVSSAFTSGAYAGEGVVGATCWSNVQVFKNGRNMCFNTGEQFYPGVLMTVAKEATIKKCQRKNALDYGDGKCYPQCKEKTYCLYGDSK